MLPLHQMDGSLHRPRAIISWHEQPPPYKMHNFSQRVDHFNFFHSSVFSQRYLVADTHFSQGSPIFVFTGAEGGDIEPLYKFGDYGTPIAFAKSLGALVVFLECRYFGESLPFGNASFDALANRIGLLSIEQILADYQVLIQKIRDEYGWNSPLVTFGGSLAGTLAVLMRVRYPALVDAAWSSSAPLLGYIGTGVSQFAWRAQVTKNYDTLVSGCVSFVRDAFTALQHAPAASVRDAMKTCEDAYSGSWSDVQGAMWGVIESAGEFCYPPSISPIHAYCRALESAGRHDGSGGGRRDVGGGSGNHGGGSSYHSGGRYYDGGGNQSTASRSLFEAASARRERTLRGVEALLRAGAPELFSTLSDGHSCLNLTAARIRAAESAPGWDFLACTEVIHPIGSNNVTDFFPPSTWSVAQTAAWCEPQFGQVAVPQPRWLPSEFGLYHLERFRRAHSHILFTYGLRDPWHTQGIGLANLSTTLPIVTIADGTHCADMASASPHDTMTMKQGRADAEAILRAWLNETADASSTEKQSQTISGERNGSLEMGAVLQRMWGLAHAAYHETMQTLGS